MTTFQTQTTSSPIPADVLARRAKAVPNYTPFVLGGVFGGRLVRGPEWIEHVTLDVPHGKRGSAEIRGWAKWCGARWNPQTKAWTVAGEDLAQRAGGSFPGSTVLDVLNSLRLITDFKAYVPAYVARNIGVRTIWVRCPYAHRALVKAFKGAGWDPVDRVWKIPVLFNDLGFAKALADIESRGWVDIANTERHSPLYVNGSMSTLAVSPSKQSEAESTPFVNTPVQSGGSPRRSTRTSRLNLVHPGFTLPDEWFAAHIEAAKAETGESPCPRERLFLAGVLDLYHSRDRSDVALDHRYLKPDVSVLGRERQDYAVAFDFFHPTAHVSSPYSDVVRVGVYLIDDSHPLYGATGSGSSAYTRNTGWNWAYLMRGDARAVWNRLTGTGWTPSSVSRSLNIGESVGWIVSGRKHWPTDKGDQIAVRELTMLRAGRSNLNTTQPFAFPIPDAVAASGGYLWSTLRAQYAGAAQS